MSLNQSKIAKTVLDTFVCYYIMGIAEFVQNPDMDLDDLDGVIDKLKQNEDDVIDVVSSLAPVVGDVRDATELIGGIDVVNQKQLDVGDRVIRFAGLVLPFVGGGGHGKIWQEIANRGGYQAIGT